MILGLVITEGCQNHEGECVPKEKFEDTYNKLKPPPQTNNMALCHRIVASDASLRICEGIR